MTDREQIRRDVKARDRLAVWLDDFNAGYATLAGLRFDVRALLAELEQADGTIAILTSTIKRLEATVEGERKNREQAERRADTNAASWERACDQLEQAERERDEALASLAREAAR